MGFIKKIKHQKIQREKKKQKQKRQSISACICYFFQETRG
jgi:hypothetical protein